MIASEPRLTYKPLLLPTLLMFFGGWGGIALQILVFQAEPTVWARWIFIFLWTLALAGTSLPVFFFFALRFPLKKPASVWIIVRRATLVAIGGSVWAWLEMGSHVTVYAVLGLAGGLALIEFFLRLRETSLWRPPRWASPVDPGEGGQDTPPPA